MVETTNGNYERKSYGAIYLIKDEERLLGADSGYGEMSHYCHEAACTKKIPDDRDYCPDHELHYESEHIHQFVIPVEWRYEYEENPGGDHTGPTLVIVAKNVIRLRCECGEEMER